MGFGNLQTVPRLSFRAPEPVSRKIRAAARRRGVPVSRFIKEAAEREAADVGAEEPNEMTATAIREPVNGLTKYHTVDEAWRSLKSDAKRPHGNPLR
jgi:uncharacterized protein (DUF1778 family)